MSNVNFALKCVHLIKGKTYSHSLNLGDKISNDDLQ